MNNYQIVERDGINHVFPDTIPRKRSNWDVVAKIIVSFGLIAVGCGLSENKWNYLVFLNAKNYLILTIIEFIKRCCHLFEEKNHINSRYNKKITVLFYEIFSFNPYNWVLLAVALLLCLFETKEPDSIHEFGLSSLPWMLSFFAVSLLAEIIRLEESGIYTALLIEKLKGLDYGSGMAHSFFFGYLQLILPQSSSHAKSVKTNIETYQSNHNVKFETKKLYVLMPLSGHCPNSLSDISDKIEDGDASEQIKLDIAGVRDRVYGNTVYKLLPENGEVVYVMAEYATPLRTLSKAIAQNSDEARRYKRYKKEIVTNFYITCDKLLRRDLDCKDYCHLIYFKDIDEHGEPLQVDICDLLLERIRYDQKT